MPSLVHVPSYAFYLSLPSSRFCAHTTRRRVINLFLVLSLVCFCVIKVQSVQMTAPVFCGLKKIWLARLRAQLHARHRANWHFATTRRPCTRLMLLTKTTSVFRATPPLRCPEGRAESYRRIITTARVELPRRNGLARSLPMKNWYYAMPRLSKLMVRYREMARISTRGLRH